MSRETTVGSDEKSPRKKGCHLEGNIYEKGIKITDEELDKINLLRHEFHEEWNYTISKNT